MVNPCYTRLLAAESQPSLTDWGHLWLIIHHTAIVTSVVVNPCYTRLLAAGFTAQSHWLGSSVTDHTPHSRSHLSGGESMLHEAVRYWFIAQSHWLGSSMTDHTPHSHSDLSGGESMLHEAVSCWVHSPVSLTGVISDWSYISWELTALDYHGVNLTLVAVFANIIIIWDRVLRVRFSTWIMCPKQMNTTRSLQTEKQIIYSTEKRKRKKEENVSFNNALNTFYLWLYVVRPM